MNKKKYKLLKQRVCLAIAKQNNDTDYKLYKVFQNYANSLKKKIKNGG